MLDADGLVVGCNRPARDMVPQLHGAGGAQEPQPHANDLFAMPFPMLFDASRRMRATIDVPLWSGLHLQAVCLPAHLPTAAAAAAPAGRDAPPATAALDVAGQRRLRDIETALIRKTVEETRGNVTEAATRLGVSRATVYRRLGLRRP